jgi:hypothetical protein
MEAPGIQIPTLKPTLLEALAGVTSARAKKAAASVANLFMDNTSYSLSYLPPSSSAQNMPKHYRRIWTSFWGQVVPDRRGHDMFFLIVHLLGEGILSIHITTLQHRGVSCYRS